MSPERLSRFHELLATLPEVGNTDSPEEELRAVLRYIVIPAMQLDDAQVQIPAESTECPNCSEPSLSTKSPYCGEQCRAMAAFIRQFRTSFADGVIFNADRQIGMGQALWSLQGGGFPRRQTMVNPREVERVLEKAEHRCWKCGEPATGVDHFGSACNRTSNLRAVCDACNRGKGFGVAGYDHGPEVKKIYREVALRVGQDEPVRACDDAASWDWREIVKLRKAALKDSLPNDG